MCVCELCGALAAHCCVSCVGPWLLHCCVSGDQKGPVCLIRNPGPLPGSWPPEETLTSLRSLWLYKGGSLTSQSNQNKAFLVVCFYCIYFLYTCIYIYFCSFEGPDFIGLAADSLKQWAKRLQFPATSDNFPRATSP